MNSTLQLTQKNFVNWIKSPNTTKSLSLNIISENNQYRHQLILDLHSKGYTDIEITNYLNENNILTPTGKKYYYELVSVTRKKLRLRDIRKTTFSYELGKLVFH